MAEAAALKAVRRIPFRKGEPCGFEPHRGHQKQVGPIGKGSAQIMGNRPTRITERMAQILRLAGEGYTDRAIAAMLFISEATVKTHVENSRRVIERATGQTLPTRKSAIMAAHRAGMLSVNCWWEKKLREVTADGGEKEVGSSGDTDSGREGGNKDPDGG